MYIRPNSVRAAFTLRIPGSWNLGLETSSSESSLFYLDPFTYMMAYRTTLTEPRMHPVNLLPLVVHNKPVIRRCITCIWQTRWSKQ